MLVFVLPLKTFIFLPAASLRSSQLAFTGVSHDDSGRPSVTVVSRSSVATAVAAVVVLKWP